MRRHTTSLVTAMALCFLAFGAASASAVAPTIPLTTFSHVTTSSATLEADINPQGKASLYHFEYGSADCSSNSCTSIPNPEGEIKKGESAVRVTAQIEGLTPGTTYHFRVVAKNAEGTAKGPDRIFATYLLPPVFGPCSNDLFRNGKLSPADHPSDALPECRAYEQASPMNKNGLDVSGIPVTVKASPSGDKVTFAAQAGMPGGTGGQRLPTYLASRGLGSWSSRGLLPPESAGQNGSVAGWTRDFSHVFSEARKFAEPTGTKTFLTRSTVDGSLITIVPHTVLGEGGSYYFAGASVDGSKVFLEAVGAPLTPGAAADKDNLYVWDRASGKLSLVGVLPDSACGSLPCVPPGGSFAGPYAWVRGASATGRGGAQDDYYTQEGNAISTDGSRAYFTAGTTGQIYLRNDPAGPGASTIHISASRKKNGSGEHGTDANGTQPAAFMAATPDGSKAFFTSSEKLTDDATTGTEPPLPAIARADIGGNGADVSFLPARAAGIAVEGSYVYWANSIAGAIGRAKLDGNGVSEVNGEFITGADNPQDVAVDGEHVYWTNAADQEPGTGSIGRADIDDGSDVKQDFIPGVVAGVITVYNPGGIDVDGGHVFWANRGIRDGLGGPTETHESKSLMRANLDGSGVEEITQPSGDNYVPEDLAVDGTHLYLTHHTEGVKDQTCIKRVDLTTNTFTNPVCSSAANPEGRFEGVAVDGSHLYWSTTAQDRISRANLDGSEEVKEFITGASNPRALAVDASHVYWSANGEAVPNRGNDLYRYDVDSEKLTDLAPDLTDENGAEVRGVLGISDDGSHVYFVANGVLTNTPNTEGETAEPGTCPLSPASVAGACNLYLAHEVPAGEIEISFIARLANGSEPRTDAANWIGTPTVFPALTEKTARVSPDGRTLLFRSQRKLTAYDNEGKRQLYRYDADDGGINCVSCNPTGAPVVSALPVRLNTAFLPPSSPAPTLSRNLSTSGERVFFESTDALLATDTNGDAGCPTVGSSQQSFRACQDVYMWEAKGSGSCESEAQNGGCLYLISSGKSPDPSFLIDASASGDDVFIITRERFVGQDEDQLYDVYDARVGGGLASQNEVAPVPCEGDACKRAPTVSPVTESPGSELFIGPPDPNEPKSRCPKSKRIVRSKGKTRCVAKQSKRHKRNAKTTRRASR